MSRPDKMSNPEEVDVSEKKVVDYTSTTTATIFRGGNVI